MRTCMPSQVGVRAWGIQSKNDLFAIFDAQCDCRPCYTVLKRRDLRWYKIFYLVKRDHLLLTPFFIIKRKLKACLEKNAKFISTLETI
jgi:hypothetical protein